MRFKSKETCRAAGKIENDGAPDGSDLWEGVLERSVRAQPRGPPYTDAQWRREMARDRTVIGVRRRYGLRRSQRCRPRDASRPHLARGTHYATAVR
jgi:hypothetical protein